MVSLRILVIPAIILMSSPAFSDSLEQERAESESLATTEQSQPLSGKALPEIDFSRHLVIFSRNREYYTRIKIEKVDVKDGVAEVLAMETMSAIPIEDKFAISIAVVFRQGIIALKRGEEMIPVDDQR